MSGTPTTWSNPLRSLSRTSSAASTVSSFADDTCNASNSDKKSVLGDHQQSCSVLSDQQPPVESVSTTSILVQAPTASSASPNNSYIKHKDYPHKTEHVQQGIVANNMVPVTTAAAARALSAAATVTTTSSNFLSGKLALVTGGSGTIGMAIATALVKNKASVVLTGRNVNRLKAAVEKIREACPEAPENSVKLVSCDVSKEDSVEKLFNTLDVYKDKRVDIVRVWLVFEKMLLSLSWFLSNQFSQNV